MFPYFEDFEGLYSMFIVQFLIHVDLFLYVSRVFYMLSSWKLEDSDGELGL